MGASAVSSAPPPDFVIAGAAKSGTTALYQYLAEHPRLFLTDPKEPHYFALAGTRPAFTGPGDDRTINRLAVTDRGRYLALYEGAAPGSLRGEASVSTLYDEDAPRRLHEHNPAARVICILRDPADRAFSAYSFMRTRTFEPCEQFEQALDDEPRRIAAGWHHIWHYQAMGRYAEQLARLFEVFPREQVLVLLYEEFARQPQAVLERTYRFLGVEPITPTVTPEPHRSGEPRFKTLSRVVNTPHPAKRVLGRIVPSGARAKLRSLVGRHNVVRGSYGTQTRERLVAGFADDIARLETLLAVDLSTWRTIVRDGPP
ncbi:sulfotransferase [Rhabdothermincola sp.]|uniref:sulfotransferase n=1 Tax=Rhabdothermincola sp. TaxID=2820405 RepID=UPI002FE3B6A4